MGEKPQAVQVAYCGVCGLPAEYCEFGPDFEKCKPWLIQNTPHLYPFLIQESNSKEADKVSDQLQSSSLSDSATGPSVTGSSVPKQEPAKRTPGGKVKKKERQEVIIEKVTRNKCKSITTLKGLELFGVKLSDASKKLGKKFATGASVVKGPTEKDQFDVQGDIAYNIVEFITDTWPDIIKYILPLLDHHRHQSLNYYLCSRTSVTSQNQRSISLKMGKRSLLCDFQRPYEVSFGPESQISPIKA